MSTIFKRQGIWQYSYFEDGKRRKKSLKVKDRRVAEILKARLDLDFSKQSAGIAVDRNIIEYLAWYKAVHYSNLKPQSAKKQERILTRFINETGVKRVSQATTTVIHEWLLSKKISPKTWNNVRGELHTFFKKAVPKHLEKNPVNDIPFRKVPQSHVDFYSDEEYRRIEEAAAADPQIRDMVIVARYTGMRIGEILHLEGEDIVLCQNALIYVKNKPKWGYTVKNYQTRGIPLSAEAKGKIGHLAQRKGLLFPNENGTPYKNLHETRLNAILKKAGVKRDGRAWHLLRHTFASRAVQNGVPLFVVMKWLGHADYKTTLRYSHLSPEYSPEIEKINLSTATISATAPTEAPQFV